MPPGNWHEKTILIKKESNSNKSTRRKNNFYKGTISSVQTIFIR